MARLKLATMSEERWLQFPEIGYYDSIGDITSRTATNNQTRRRQVHGRRCGLDKASPRPAGIMVPSAHGSRPRQG